MTEHARGLSWKDRILIRLLAPHASKRITIDEVLTAYSKKVGGCPNRASMLNNMARLVELGFCRRSTLGNGNGRTATYLIADNAADFDT